MLVGVEGPLRWDCRSFQRRRTQPGYPVLPATWQRGNHQLRCFEVYPKIGEFSMGICPEFRPPRDSI